MGKWMDIESAPKDGTEVFLFYPQWHDEHNLICVAFYDWSPNDPQEINASWYSPLYGHTGTHCTHWMPLPATP